MKKSIALCWAVCFCKHFIAAGKNASTPGFVSCIFASKIIVHAKQQRHTKEITGGFIVEKR